MCGRARLMVSSAALAELYGFEAYGLELPFDDNIAPTDLMTVVRVENGKRRLARLRWGLLPPWAKDPRESARTFNARVESAALKPTFRDAFRRRRCLVLADGFYEWQRRGVAKRAYLVQTSPPEPFAMAGLWDRWVSPDGEVVESCTVLTQDAVPPIRELHDRMPVLLPRELQARWLDPSLVEPTEIESLLRDVPGMRLTVEPTVVPRSARRVSPPAVEPATTPNEDAAERPAPASKAPSSTAPDAVSPAAQLKLFDA